MDHIYTLVQRSRINRYQTSDAMRRLQFSTGKLAQIPSYQGKKNILIARHPFSAANRCPAGMSDGSGNTQDKKT